MARSISDPKTAKRFALGAGLLVMVAFYAWTALPNVGEREAPNPPAGTPGHYPPAGPGELYNALAEALLAGKTALLIRPRAELLALDDPYDPLQNHRVDAQGRYCVHDAALYRGKYYVYFGVVPALTLFAPFLLVTGHYLPTAAAALLLASAGLTWTALLLNLLADRFHPALAARVRLCLVLVVGTCSGVPFLLRSPYMYEVAILGAYAFTAAGLFFLACGMLSEAPRPWSVALGSLSLGLAVGCRPHMGLVALVVFAVAAIWGWRRLRSLALSWRELAGWAARLVAPWLAIVVLLGLYNNHRFHGFAEFGSRYNLVGGTVRQVDLPVLDWHRLQADLYFYLLFPPELQNRFPYVHLRVPDPSLLPEGHFGVTPIAGVLLGMPFLALLALAPWTLNRIWRYGRAELLAVFAVVLAGGVLEMFCVACFGGAMRYLVDFANLLVLAALLIGFDLDQGCQGRRCLQWPLRATLAAALLVGCLFQLAISIEGQRGLPRDLAVRDRLRGFFPRLHFTSAARRFCCRSPVAEAPDRSWHFCRWSDW